MYLFFYTFVLEGYLSFVSYAHMKQVALCVWFDFNGVCCRRSLFIYYLINFLFILFLASFLRSSFTISLCLLYHFCFLFLFISSPFGFLFFIIFVFVLIYYDFSWFVLSAFFCFRLCSFILAGSSYILGFRLACQLVAMVTTTMKGSADVSNSSDPSHSQLR